MHFHDCQRVNWLKVWAKNWICAGSIYSYKVLVATNHYIAKLV
jgi:hypothetical protein